MSSKQKRINRFKSIPSDYRENELKSLLEIFGFAKTKSKGGKVKYQDNKGNKITYHPPHDTGTFKKHYIEEWKEALERWGYI